MGLKTACQMNIFLNKMSHYNGYGVRYLIFPNLNLIKKKSRFFLWKLNRSAKPNHHFPLLSESFSIHNFYSGCNCSISYSIINFESKILMQKNHIELLFHLPRGGPCVISISIPSGIRFHLSSKD